MLRKAPIPQSYYLEYTDIYWKSIRGPKDQIWKRNMMEKEGVLLIRGLYFLDNSSQARIYPIMNCKY